MIEIILILLATISLNIMSNYYINVIKNFYGTIPNFLATYKDTSKFLRKYVSIVSILVIIDVYMLYLLFVSVRNIL